MNVYHINHLDHMKTPVTEHYVMVLNNMVLLLKLVIKHVLNSNFLHYKMEMENKDDLNILKKNGCSCDN